MKKIHCDFLIAGSGIVGLAIAREIHERFPKSRILVIEKESEVAQHGSGRNSGVVHAGFYYTANSLKAKFTAEGNRQIKAYCARYGLGILNCGKVVVAKDEAEWSGIFELERRGKANGVNVEVIDQKRLQQIEPHAKTFKNALWSPDTSSVNPVEISNHIFQNLKEKGVQFLFQTKFERRLGANRVQAGDYELEFGHFINAAGLYADQVAKQFGNAKDYKILPFKGIYLAYETKEHRVRTHIYPVPNLKNPFLGVHFTLTLDGSLKIGPTAIPAFWRENYKGWHRFSMKEAVEIVSTEAGLFLTNAFSFRDLALEEMKKYKKPYFVGLAQSLVGEFDVSGFKKWSKPGIRAQLLDVRNNQLVQDFVVEAGENSTHILNAVSPAFTSSFPFAKWVVETYLK